MEFVLVKKRLALVMKKALGLVAFSILLVSCAPAPAVVAPEPEPAATEAAEEIEQSLTFELSLLGEDPEVCKIVENSFDPATGWGRKNGFIDSRFQTGADQKYYNGNATAFPFNPTALNVEGELNVELVLVDWEDLPGNDADREMYIQNVEKFAEFYWMVSEHNLQWNIHVSEGWFRIPGSYADFYMNPDDEGQHHQFAPKKQKLYDAITDTSDPSTDYTNVDLVIPAWPTAKTVSDEGSHDFNFRWNAAMYTDEKTIYNIAGAGDWFIKHQDYAGPWIFYVHETGHMLGIPHQAKEDANDLFGQYPHNEYFWLQNPFDGFEIMANQDGAIKTINGWLRWVAGWLDDSQVICVTQDQIDDEIFALHPINDVSGETEALVIKLSDSMAIVVESRRWDERFDRPIVHSRDGVIVYTVDATKGSSQGSQALLSPRDITKWLEVNHWRHSEELDANFCEGDFVDVAGLVIGLESSQEGVDYVRVQKSTNNFPVDPPEIGTEGGVNRVESTCIHGPGSDNPPSS